MELIKVKLKVTAKPRGDSHFETQVISDFMADIRFRINKERWLTMSEEEKAVLAENIANNTFKLSCELFF